MQKTFTDLLNIAKQNVEHNPSIVIEDTQTVLTRYTEAFRGEIDEVMKEVRQRNEVYLVDELSDLAWVYANILALLENRGLITDATHVIDHGWQKYTERTPAFLKASSELWEEIKSTQKEELARQHKKKYEKNV